MSDELDLEAPDRLTFGTVGEIGSRVFLLQVRQGATLLTVKLEKAHVAALAQHVGAILADLERPGELPTDMELEEPHEPEWVVGTLGVSYLEDIDRFLLIAEEVAEEDEEPSSVARLSATREQMAALAIRGAQLVEAGRPPCPLCGYPLDSPGVTRARRPTAIARRCAEPPLPGEA